MAPLPSDEIVEVELNARERRAYDRLRALVRRVEPGARADFRDLLLLFPDLLMLLLRLLRDPRVARGDRLLALLVVGYVLSPIDLLPTFIFGPFGLLDDLLLVAAALSRLVNRVHPDVVRSHWSGQGDVLRIIQRASQWSERNITGRLRALFGG